MFLTTIAITATAAYFAYKQYTQSPATEAPVSVSFDEAFKDAVELLRAQARRDQKIHELWAKVNKKPAQKMLIMPCTIIDNLIKNYSKGAECEKLMLKVAFVRTLAMLHKTDVTINTVSRNMLIISLIKLRKSLPGVKEAYPSDHDNIKKMLPDATAFLKNCSKPK
ncbi:hypothetical protein [Candidatus Synchoanobacter obligatus]|uniref:Uncharacterized protein n=1 Tax=Candidatus Synchoanobacter obligatus TaxID=2919597 RepID=A0ABT1L598_9GAMM|nr:hypothetical protein [Candidatus Synchoanobacter obligatus]MCP8351900.1 hypothetical protein [Candidatus Synchoanobacter obligatus]